VRDRLETARRSFFTPVKPGLSRSTMKKAIPSPRFDGSV
jgi:hypothetical protein